MNLKNKFALISSVITASSFLFFLIIPILGFLGLASYYGPVVFISKIFNLPLYTFLSNTEGFGLTFPNLKGFIILIPLWFVIGYFLGLLVYKIRERYSIKKSKPINLGFTAFIIILFLEIFVGVLFVLLGSLF